MSFPEEPPKIDWDFYASKVPVPGLVDQFKQAVSSEAQNQGCGSHSPPRAFNSW